MRENEISDKIDESQLSKKTVDWLLEMVDLVRSEYSYKDEYIIEKTFLRLNNAYELIVRRKYDEKVQQAHLIAACVSNIFAGKDKGVKVKTYDELVEEKNARYWNHDDTYINPAFSWWFWFSNQ